MSDYKELQAWSHKRRRTGKVPTDSKPGTVVKYSDGTRYAILSNGSRRRLPSQEVLPDAQLAEVLGTAKGPRAIVRGIMETGKGEVRPQSFRTGTNPLPQERETAEAVLPTCAS